MRPPPEPDLASRLMRDRPGLLARSALLSWAVGVAVAALAYRRGAEQIVWPLLILPIGVTLMAAIALGQRDPERAVMDAFRAGMLATIPSALLVGRAAARSFDAPAVGHLATACMAGAAVGAVVGALCGPVAGWALRSAARSVRAVIRRVSRV